MKWFGLRALCVAAILWLAAPFALACGDKLAVIGGGVGLDRLNRNVARGNVVLLIEPNSSLRAANDDLNLKRELEFAGHKVRTVDSTGALESLISQGQADVVLVSWQDATRLQSELATRSSSPAIVSIAYKTDAAEPAIAVPKDLCVAQAERRRGREVVEAVGHVVQQRKAGQQVDCSAARTASKM